MRRHAIIASMLVACAAALIALPTIAAGAKRPGSPTLTVAAPAKGDLALIAETVTVTAGKRISGSLVLTPASIGRWPVGDVALARTARVATAAGGRRATYVVLLAALARAPVSSAAVARAALAPAFIVAVSPPAAAAGAKLVNGRAQLVNGVLSAQPTPQLTAAQRLARGSFDLAGAGAAYAHTYVWGVNNFHEVVFGAAAIGSAFDHVAAMLTDVLKAAPAATRAGDESALEQQLDVLEPGRWLLGSLIGDGATKAPFVQNATVSSVDDATKVGAAVALQTHGLDTSFTIRYGTTTGYGQQTAATDIGSADKTTTVIISGLSADTTYHFQVVATNSAGTSSTADMTFTTDHQTPTVLRAFITGDSVNDSQADTDIALRTYGLDTTFHIRYGTTTSYGAQTDEVDAGSADTEIMGTITGLQPGTTYHFQVVATNRDGSTSTGDATFATGSGAP